MKIFIEAIVNNTDLKGVDASLVFPETGEIIECDVRYLSGQEFEDGDYQTRVPTDPAKLGVVQIEADYERSDNNRVQKSSDVSDAVCILESSPVLSSSNLKRVKEGCESYAHLRVFEDSMEIKDLPFHVSSMDTETCKKVVETIETLKLGSTNPFEWCNVSRIKVLKIDLASETPEDFGKYRKMLDDIHEEHGAGAFESLTRIRGSTEQLDYFFELFNNRRFEVMVVLGNAAPDVEDLSVDILKLCGSSYGDIRNGRQFREMRVRVNSNLSRERVLDVGDCTRVIGHELFDSVKYDPSDLSQFVVAKTVKQKYAYEMARLRDIPGARDKRYNANFYLVLEFDRSSMQKSAAKVVR